MLLIYKAFVSKLDRYHAHTNNARDLQYVCYLLVEQSRVSSVMVLHRVVQVIEAASAALAFCFNSVSSIFFRRTEMVESRAFSRRRSTSAGIFV